MTRGSRLGDREVSSRRPRARPMGRWPADRGRRQPIRRSRKTTPAPARMTAAGSHGSVWAPWGELGVEDLLDPLAQRRGEDREGDLDAVVEVPGHPVRGGEKVLLVASVQEIVDARVLEEAIDDRDDADPLGQTGQAGPEAADPPDDQVDVHAGPARRAQLLDQR